MAETKKYGRKCYPGGRTIEISAEHQEWVDWACNVLSDAAVSEACKNFAAGNRPEDGAASKFQAEIDKARQDLIADLKKHSREDLIVPVVRLDETLSDAEFEKRVDDALNTASQKLKG